MTRDSLRMEDLSRGMFARTRGEDPSPLRALLNWPNVGYPSDPVNRPVLLQDKWQIIKLPDRKDVMIGLDSMVFPAAIGIDFPHRMQLVALRHARQAADLCQTSWRSTSPLRRLPLRMARRRWCRRLGQ